MSDIDYHRTRERQEQGRAASAPSESVARIHLELAEQHRLRCRDAAPAAPRPLLRVVLGR